MSNFNVSVLFKLIDKVSEPARRMSNIVNRTNNSFNSMSGPAKRIGEVGRNAAATAGKMALLGGGAAWAFKRQFIDTAAEFERYGTILETLEGSGDKAKKSMDWISNFAATTPFEMDKVTGAFVKLRSYGLDPTNGLLQTLGDTSAAMGKDINQAVEAVADAVTGENERLKEFGIKARNESGTITYEFTNKEGIQEEIAVAANDRAAIEEALSEIFNNKFAGSMQKQMKTWNGMMSNLGDQWMRFKVMVMGSGLFDYLKNAIGGILKRVDALAKSGQLEVIAKDFGVKLVNGIKATVEAVKTVWSIFSGFLSIIGGVKSLVAILAVMFAGKFVVAIYAAATAFKALTLAMIANPIGAVIAGIAIGAALIVAHWDTVKTWFSKFFEFLKFGFDHSPLGLLIKGGKFVAGLFGGDDKKAPGNRNEKGESGQAAGIASTPTPILKAPGAAPSNLLNIDYGGINVHAAPGMDEKALANEVRKELAARDRKAAAQQRGLMFDYAAG